MKDITLKILGMDCAACVSRLDKAIGRVPGVKSVTANYAARSAYISCSDGADMLEKIAAAVKKAGFRVPIEEVDIKTDDAAKAAAAARTVYGVKDVQPCEGGITVYMWPVRVDTRDIVSACESAGIEAEAGETRGGDEDQEIDARMSLLRTLVMSAACASALMLELHPKVQLVIGTILQFGPPGRYFYKGAWRSLRSGAAGMDLLISLSSTLIYGYSSYVALTRTNDLRLYFASDGVLLSLILFGKYMEQVASGQAGEAIRKLMRLAPRTAMVKRGGDFIELPVDSIKISDTVLVRPGERIAADGVISSGSLAVDESMLTGESLPVDRGEGDKVIGGSLNRAGSAEISVTALGKDSVLSQIIAVVRRAQSEKAPVQRFADSVARWFVPAVIAAAAATFGFWYLRSPHNIEQAILNCCDVLSVACPCALGLATPTGLMVGSGRAAENGILFRSGAELERACECDCVVFDKTGTLTRGTPTVTKIIPHGVTELELVSLSAAIEQKSDHPLAKAVIEYAAKNYPNAEKFDVEDFAFSVGSGVSGTISGEKIVCASPRALGIDSEAQICVTRSGSLIGEIFIADELKPESRETVEALKGRGIEPIMLTGDNEKTAKAIAGRAGIDRVLSGVMPEAKEAEIERLKKAGKTVCMVGDGINDTPSLAAADCAVAMGTGSDIAIESAGVLLPSGNLNKLTQAMDISARTMKVIRQNLRWALLYNIISIPVAAAGLLHPSICAAAMSLSSIGVLMHSLSIKKDGRKWKKKR